MFLLALLWLVPEQEEPEVRAELCQVSSEYLVSEWYMTAPCLVCDCAALQPSKQ